MKQIAFLLIIIITSAISAAGPNILVILADDQGWGDLSIHGNTNLATPHIDSLGREGVMFENFYVCPVCSPTRAEFLTGRYHSRGGVISTSTGGERLSLDQQTIGDIQPLLTIEEILRARRVIRKEVQLSKKITEYIYSMVAATREHPMLLAGISTRGAISLAETVRSHAFLAGRDHVIPEDVKALFVPVCAHRLIMYPEHETLDRKELLQSLLDEIPVPLA